MSDILITLGDDWHNPHPYAGFISSILPGLSFNLIVEIEKFLLRVYEAQHYEFKTFKDKSKATIYDLDISRAENQINTLKGDQKKEEEGFERLCKKLQDTIQEQRKQGFIKDENYEQEEEEEEEEEEVDYNIEKDVQVKQKNSKEEAKKRRELEVKLATAVKSTQTAMATVQQKLIDYQKEIENLEKKKKYYEHYKDASWYYQGASRKLVLEYEQKRDLEALVKGFHDVLSYYIMLRRRYVPSDPCKGEGKSLCETHLLPLSCTKWSEKGDPIVWKCALYA